MLNLVGYVPVQPSLVFLQVGDDVPLILPFSPKQVEHDWLLVLVGIWYRQRLHYGGVEQRKDEIPICLGVGKPMGVVYQSIHHILVGECHLR